MEDLDADFQNHGLDILEIIIDKLRNAESNRCCLGILLKRMETLKIVLDGPGRKIKIDSFANIYTLIQSAEVISNLYCYHVSKTYYQHPVKAGKAREEIQHLVEHIGISLQETSLNNFAQVAPMQEYSLLFDTAELNDNSATVLALQGMPELEDTDMLDAVVDEFRARNSLLAAGLSKGRPCPCTDLEQGPVLRQPRHPAIQRAKKPPAPLSRTPKRRRRRARDAALPAISIWWARGRWARAH